MLSSNGPSRNWPEAKLKLLEQLYPHYSNTLLSGLFASSPHNIGERARTRGWRKQLRYGHYRQGDLSPLLEETPEAYYWNGFIMADGHFTDSGQLVISLSEVDRGHLEKLAYFLKTRVKTIATKRSSGYTKTEGTVPRIAIQQPEIVEALRDKFDYRKRKTENPPYLSPVLVEDWQFLSFWAGMVDGDGSISVLRSGSVTIRVELFHTWFNTLNEFNYRLHEILGVPVTSEVKLSEYALVSINKRYVIEKLLAALRELELPLMERKWSKVKW